MPAVTWPQIVANMPGAKWVVKVHGPGDSVETHEIPFADTVDTDGLVIGNVAPAHVLVHASAIPPTRAAVVAAGMHQFVSFLEGVVVVHGNPLTESYVRFDRRPLVFGEFTVYVGWSQ